MAFDGLWLADAQVQIFECPVYGLPGGEAYFPGGDGLRVGDDL